VLHKTALERRRPSLTAKGWTGGAKRCQEPAPDDHDGPGDGVAEAGRGGKEKALRDSELYGPGVAGSRRACV
jgi:hypothetical protein